MTIVSEAATMSVDQEQQPDSSSTQQIVQLQSKESSLPQSKSEPRAVYVALRDPAASSAFDTAVVTTDTHQNYNAFQELTLIEATYPEPDKKDDLLALQDSRVVVQPVFDQQNVILSHDSSVATTLVSLSTAEVTLPTEPLPLNQLNGQLNEAVDLSGLDQIDVQTVGQSGLMENGYVMQQLNVSDNMKELPRIRHHSSFELSSESQFPASYMSNSSRQRSCSTSSSPYSVVSSRSPNSSPNSPSSNLFPSLKALIPDETGQTKAKAVKRKMKNPIPDKNKDEGYWRRRLKNNMAAKRSREAKRMKDDQMYQKSSILEESNKELGKRLDDALEEIQALKKRLSKYEEI